MTRTLLFALAVALTSISAPTVAQRTVEPGPPPGVTPGRPGFVDAGPPKVSLPVTLYTSPLDGLSFRCSVLNTTGLPLDVSIVLVKESNEEFAAAADTIPPREVRSVVADREHLLGSPVTRVIYCRITFQGDREAVRGVLEAHVGEVFSLGGDRHHERGSISSEAR